MGRHACYRVRRLKELHAVAQHLRSIYGGVQSVHAGTSDVSSSEQNKSRNNDSEQNQEISDHFWCSFGRHALHTLK